MSVIRKIKSIKRSLFKEKYDNYKYWQNRGKIYFDNFQSLSAQDLLRYKLQEQHLIDFLSKLNFNSVCEAGCGFGRITKLVLDKFNISKECYFAFDLSQDQIRRAQQYVGDRAEFVTSSIETVRPSKQYELVLAAEVLMHISHENIFQALTKLAEISSKYIVNIDWKETEKSKSSFFCFAHDYPAMYEKLGFDVEVIDLDLNSNSVKINQRIYFAKKRVL